MYEEFYRLAGSPFQLTPDARFFFNSKVHSRAIAHLTFGMAQGEGFIIITGEVGAGKTTLVERLWAGLDRDAYVIARINTTQVSSNDLFRLAMAGFGVEDTAAEKSTLLLRFEQILKENRRNNKRCLLVVDEVQTLSLKALEELRMLSNITENGQPMMQTILLGQPQFRNILTSPELDQLRQRVLASFHLGPLTRDETRAYIEHRLHAVGWADNPHWEDGAFEAVFNHTEGIPRRINRLSARTLLFGALEESTRITRDMVDATAAELHRDLDGGPARPLRSAASAGEDAHVRELSKRVSALEIQVAHRERMLQRLFDLISGHGVEV